LQVFKVLDQVLAAARAGKPGKIGLSFEEITVLIQWLSHIDHDQVIVEGVKGLWFNFLFQNYFLSRETLNLALQLCYNVLVIRSFGPIWLCLARWLLLLDLPVLLDSLGISDWNLGFLEKRGVWNRHRISRLAKLGVILPILFDVVVLAFVLKVEFFKHFPVVFELIYLTFQLIDFLQALFEDPIELQSLPSEPISLLDQLIGLDFDNRLLPLMLGVDVQQFGHHIVQSSEEKHIVINLSISNLVV
jgi:hypothetical protein